MRRVWPEGRLKPPSAITGWPAFGAVAGHIGKGHLLLIYKETGCAAAFSVKSFSVR